MSQYKTLSNQLEDVLELSSSPVAISFHDVLPENIPSFERTVPAGCVFWEEGSKGIFVTSTQDHELCAIGVHTHHLSAPSKNYQNELKETLQAMIGLDYVREEEVAQIPVLNRIVRHIVYGPLAEIPFAPDVVLLFARAQQSLIIGEAVQRVDGDAPPAMGRPACAIIPQVMNGGLAAMSLGCCGARAYLENLSDDLALWALPGKKIERYVQELSRFAKANKTLSVFHTRRKADVALGEKPTVQESLARVFS